MKDQLWGEKVKGVGKINHWRVKEEMIKKIRRMIGEKVE